VKPLVIHHGNSSCRISTPVHPVTAETLSEACMYEVEGAEFMIRENASKFAMKSRFGSWDGKKRLYHKGYRTFPTGLLPLVMGILQQHDYDVKVTGKPPAVFQLAEHHRFNISQGWELRAYQQEAVDCAFDAERCMVRVPTGGGKTVIAAHIIEKCATLTVFLVHTKDLLYQAKEMFESIFGTEIGQIGDGIVDIKPVTVCTVQTAAKALGVKYTSNAMAEGDDAFTDKVPQERLASIAALIDRAGCVMMDECHRIAAPTAMDVLSAIKNAPYRFGFSASPWRDDGADLALEAVFGQVAYTISATALIDMGFLVRPIISFKSVPPKAYPKKTKYAEVYTDYIVNNDARNAIGVKAAQRNLARGIRTLVLVRQIAHGKHIQEWLSKSLGFDVPFLSGKDDSTVRNAVIGDMRAGRLPMLIATTIADEGLDVKPLAGLVLLGGGKSSTRALQRVGRVLRPFEGKNFATVTDFEDNALYLVHHSAKRAKIYGSEPGFTITDV
jgi:superfamily II DNA or RNA helicase